MDRQLLLVLLPMAYDERLAARVRRALAGQALIGERRMFGGLTFLSGGHACCGIVGNELMVRVGPDRYDEALGRRHAREMDFTGRPLKGYVYISREGVRSTAALRAWVAMGVDYASTLPPKRSKTRHRR